MDSPTAEITAGKLSGKLLTNFTGSISDFVKSYGCSDGIITKYAGKEFSNVELYRGIPYAESLNVIEQAQKFTKKFDED